MKTSAYLAASASRSPFLTFNLIGSGPSDLFSDLDDSVLSDFPGVDFVSVFLSGDMMVSEINRCFIVNN